MMEQENMKPIKLEGTDKSPIRRYRKGPGLVGPDVAG